MPKCQIPGCNRSLPYINDEAAGATIVHCKLCGRFICNRHRAWAVSIVGGKTIVKFPGEYACCCISGKGFGKCTIEVGTQLSFSFMKD